MNLLLVEYIKHGQLILQGAKKDIPQVNLSFIIAQNSNHSPNSKDTAHTCLISRGYIVSFRFKKDHKSVTLKLFLSSVSLQIVHKHFLLRIHSNCLAEPSLQVPRNHGNKIAEQQSVT